jgi:four helix bundle protein
MGNLDEALATMRSNFENLRVYQLSEEIADRIWALVTEWDLFAKDTVGRELVRAADSVGANIAEGDGSGSYADSRRFVRTAHRSLNETQHFLRRAYRRKLLTESDVNALKLLVNELGPKLNTFLSPSAGLLSHDRHRHFQLNPDPDP